ncbi:tetratricopeptide repeat protein [Neolewinella litorea]|uniref:Tetratricopeptide repeat protein n=1 Tax=Neolewinella litorea TaxID=2562452 RepID=A0A4S4NVP5_9BACT|nr:tetratricopeptide repeat protein [Neolewinella litorea]THH40330.1 tetratricopeptide repeat protein [Neolewinella litorea]
MLKKDLAGFFAFFLGVFGVHRFYLGQWWRGAAQFLGFWTVIALLAEEGPEMPLPFILVGFILAPLITAVVFWATPYERWAAKYDPEALVAQGYTYPQKNGHATYRPPTVQRQPLQDLKAEGIKYYRSGDYDLAAEAFEEAIEQAPTDPVAHFNIACCYALLGRYPQALTALEIAVTYQLPKPQRIESHPALESLRKTTAYSTFRSNNFRQLNLIEITHEPTAKVSDDEEDLGDLRENHDLLEQMARLKELHDTGILTQLEYRKQREKLLS